MQAGAVKKRRADQPAKRLHDLIENQWRSLRERPTWKALALVHPFAAPMSPYLAERIINAATEADDVVLDPMAGSGTVPVTAMALSRSCWAMDIDPLALMIMEVRCGRYSQKEIEYAADRVLTQALDLQRDYRALDARFRKDFDEETQGFINYWFPLQARRSLIALWDAVCQVEPKHVRLPLKVAFSRTIIAKTAGASYAVDLPHTRPHRDFAKEVPDPLVLFPRRVKELVRLMHNGRGSNDRPTLHLISGDARKLPLNDNSVDLILTSSPYANAIDYMRAHKFSLVWMGYKISYLRELRARMIGAERGVVESAPELRWLESWLPNSPVLASRIAILRRFFHDMDSALTEMYRVLRPGGACVLIVGKSYVRGHLIDTPRILTEIARNRGFDHLGTVYRSLNRNRRYLPFPRSARPDEPLGKRMAQEAIVALAR